MNKITEMSSHQRKIILTVASWALGFVVLSLAGIVWFQERVGGAMTAYSLFPLLGLAAFSLMWTHYVLGTIRRTLNLPSLVNKLYSQVSGGMVLVFLVLHPGILIAALYRDGFGLPPQSYLTVYADQGMKVAIGFGSVALIVFLLFELRARYGDRRWWAYIDRAQLIAMTLIFFHGLSLGRELAVSWYRAVWYLFGATFVFSAVYNYWYEHKHFKEGTRESGRKET